jgi:5-methyltetrahydrofolate--homocysteine methyltransferase
MIIIGEKLNGSIPSMGKAIAARDEETIKDLAKKQTEQGATFIDVCASVEESVEVETMKWMIDLVQSVTDLPIAVDSPSPHAIAGAMTACNKPGLLNSASMEGDKIDTLFPIVRDNPGWGIVCLLCDDTGIPHTAEDRLKVFGDIMAKAKEYDIDPSRIYIDPLVEMACTTEDALEMITTTIKGIKEQYPTIHVAAAISNISFNLPVRKIMNAAFTILCMNAGMDAVICDPLARDLIGLMFATEALMGTDESGYCMDYIEAYRDGLFGPVK